MTSATRARALRSVACLLLGLVAAYLWQIQSSDGEAHRETRVWNGFSARTFTRNTSKEKRQADSSDPSARAVQRWIEKLVAENPDFEIPFRKVEDSKNGFLQMVRFVDGLGQDSLFPKAISEMLDGKQAWDAEAFSAWLSENRTLFERILAIAELSERSAKGLPLERLSSYSLWRPREMNQLLLATARLDAERGNFDSAFRLYAASSNFADHFDGIEMAGFTSRNASWFLRFQSLEAFQQQILPHLVGEPSELARWRGVVTYQPNFSEEVPSLLLAEWHFLLSQHLLPAIIRGDVPKISDEIPDLSQEPDRLPLPDGEAVLAVFTRKIREMQESGQLSDFDPSEHASERLSEGGEQLMQWLFTGHEHWENSSNKAETRFAMYDALMAVALDGPLPFDPVSGDPFVWDPATRTLHPPEGMGDIEPLTLP